MTRQRKWLVVIGLIAATTASLAIGVPVGTLLLAGSFLLCSAAMYFGMSGMHQGCGHSGKCDHAETPDGGRQPRDLER